MLRQIIISLAGILCLGYYTCLCIYLKKWNATFSRFWLASGIGFLMLSFLDGEKIVPVVVWWLILAGLGAVAVTFLIIVSAMIPRHEVTGDYLIVLGAQVKGRKITDSLRRRLEKAQFYLVKHKDMKVIVSGGQGKGEEITEAEAMAEYLRLHGIVSERIFLEDQSKTTMQNLKFSAQFLEKEIDSVGILSNNFHLYRACRMAKKLGYQKVMPVAASCHPLLFINYMMREVLAVWKLWICG